MWRRFGFTALGFGIFRIVLVLYAMTQWWQALSPAIYGSGEKIGAQVGDRSENCATVSDLRTD